MFKISKNTITYLIPIIIFFIFQLFISKYSVKGTDVDENGNIMKQEIMNESLLSQTEEKEEIWQIEIPKISVKAPISEGTTKEILNQYVGHFQTTAKENGNIGLAAHNRGYEVNYFQDLKLLKEGDEIIYQHNDFRKTYEVEKIRIIKDTEWTYLEETEENQLTLITCVENQPEYRRCIQAIENN